MAIPIKKVENIGHAIADWVAGQIESFTGTDQTPASYKNAYKVYLGGMILPITPSKITVTVGNKNEVIDMADGGQLNVIRKPALKTISFDFVIPKMKAYEFGQVKSATRKNQEWEMRRYLDYIEELKTERKAFEFVVSRDLDTWNGFQEYMNYSYNTNTNLVVTLEEYTITEDANEHGMDMLVSVTLKEYVEYRTKIHHSFLGFNWVK